MRMDTKFNLIRIQLEDDGMGGFVESDVYSSYWTFEALKLPVTVERLLEEYGIVSTRAMKIFTNEELPDDIELLQEHNDNLQRYKLLQLMDYGKYKMLLVEEVE